MPGEDEVLRAALGLPPRVRRKQDVWRAVTVTNEPAQFSHLQPITRKASIHLNDRWPLPLWVDLPFRDVDLTNDVEPSQTIAKVSQHF
jgi:hypothetical protein